MNKLFSLFSYIICSCFIFSCCSCSTTKDSVYNNNNIPNYEDDCEASSLFKEFRYIVDNGDVNEDITDVDTTIIRYDDNDEYNKVWKITTIKLNPSIRGYIEIEEFSHDDDDPELNHVIWWLYDTKSNREDIENLLQHDAPTKEEWINTKTNSEYFTFYKKGIDSIRELDSSKLNSNQYGKFYLITNNYNKIGLYYCTYID